MFTGNIGKDAEIKEFPKSKQIVFSVANSEKNSKGEINTTWIQCCLPLYGEGKIIDRLKKGTKVFIEGKILQTSYLKEGINVSAISVAVKDLEIYTISMNTDKEAEIIEEKITKNDDPF